MAVLSCIHHVEHTPFPKSTKTFIAQSLKIRALQPCMHSRKKTNFGPRLISWKSLESFARKILPNRLLTRINTQKIVTIV